MLTSLLEDYFACRGTWYEGPKASFAWLKANQPELFTLFEAALKLGAELVTIEVVVNAITLA